MKRNHIITAATLLLAGAAAFFIRRKRIIESRKAAVAEPASAQNGLPRSMKATPKYEFSRSSNRNTSSTDITRDTI